MSTRSRAAISSAFRSGRTLNAMMIAFDADASSTSDSFTAPTPAWMMRIFTFSSLSLASVSASTSAEPCTSALMMMGSSFMPPSAICACSDSSVRREPFAPSARDFDCSSRNVAMCRALAASATWNTSPGCGSPERPSTSTGVDGPADFVGFPRSSISARTRPTIGPAMNVSPTRSVPSCTSTVATGPRPLSSLASSTVPDALRFGLALSSPMSLTSRIISSSESMFSFCLADTSTVTVWPPHSSGINPRSVSSRFTRSGWAFALSILLIATTIGTFAALA